MKKLIVLFFTWQFLSLLSAGETKVEVNPFQVSINDPSPAVNNFLDRELRAGNPSPSMGNSLVSPQETPRDTDGDAKALGEKIATELTDKLDSHLRATSNPGTNIEISGTAFPINEDLFMAAKVTFQNTNEVIATKQSGPLANGLDPLVEGLSNNIADAVRSHASPTPSSSQP